MDLSELGEFGLIERIQRIAGADQWPVVKGCGDDTAIIASRPSSVTLVSTDAMVEGRHFHREWMSPYQVGARAAGAALSDIAAMGGTATAIFSTLCIPKSWTVEDAEELVGGLAAVAHDFGICLAGGDIVSSAGPLMIDVTALGEAHPQRLWLRAAAAVGDAVLVTGTLGNAAGAVAMLDAKRASELSGFPHLVAKLKAPVPRLEVASALSALGHVHAGIDISDGLVQDAGHVAEASGVGIELWASQIPVSRQLLDCAKSLGADALQWAAAGGEDFELLLTAACRDVSALQQALSDSPIPLTQIGQVTDGSGVRLLDDEGDEVTVTTGGWDHFRQ